MKNNVSIECALPYSTEPLYAKHKFEKALSAVTTRLDQAHQTYGHVLLVDDITSGMSEDFSLDEYTTACTQDRPTLVFRESMLNALCEQTLGELQNNGATQELQDLRSEEGYSGALYIAVWMLLRLGHVSHPDFPEAQVSERIINILPEEFRKGEEVSMQIVRQTRFPEAADRIEYVFVS